MKQARVAIAGTCVLAIAAFAGACRQPGGCGWNPCCPTAAPVEASQPEPGISADDRAVLDVLEKKKVVSLRWEETDLDAAVAYLRTITGVNFYVPPAVREKFPGLALTLSMDDVTVTTLLDLMTKPYDLRWEVREGVVWILA